MRLPTTMSVTTAGLVSSMFQHLCATKKIPHGVTFGAKHTWTDEIHRVRGLTSGLIGPWRLYLGVVSALLFDVIES